MSHFMTLVIVPKGTADVHAAVTKLLAPYDEGGEWSKDGSHWDWWQIGGRWTGALSDYDPEKDPKNREVCDLCKGTGRRTDAIARANRALLVRCNGCDGKGIHTKWPTQWAECPDDVMPIANIKKPVECFAIVTPDGVWHESGQMRWFGHVENPKPAEDWNAAVADILKTHHDAIAVVVDCHV